MKHIKPLPADPNQTELFALVWLKTKTPFRLRVNDLFRTEGRLCRVIRVTECAAVIVMNRPPREFKTRFDRPVRFEQPPVTFRVSPNAEVEILNRKSK